MKILPDIDIANIFNDLPFSPFLSLCCTKYIHMFYIFILKNILFLHMYISYIYLHCFLVRAFQFPSKILIMIEVNTEQVTRARTSYWHPDLRPGLSGIVMPDLTVRVCGMSSPKLLECLPIACSITFFKTWSLSPSEPVEGKRETRERMACDPSCKTRPISSITLLVFPKTFP